MENTGVPRSQVLALESVDVFKLRVAEGRGASRDVLAHFVQRQALFDEPVTYHMRADGSPHLADLCGN